MFLFWEQYNLDNLNRIKALLDKNQSIYLVDLHSHSDFSADGVQTVRTIIDRAVSMNFDVISITDHDSVQAYETVREIIQEYSLLGKQIPVILTGIEFTVKYDDYGDMCHILKYGFNPESEALRKNVDHNNAAFWKRAKKQFERIAENKTLMHFANQFGAQFTLFDYEAYLKTCKVSTPEYPSLISYIHTKFKPHKIQLNEIVTHIEETIKYDTSESRAKLRTLALNRFKNKYNEFLGNCDYPSRLFSPLFSVRRLDDDDYTEHRSSGNLSIRNYDQVEIKELFQEGITVFAHPNGDKLHLMKNCLDIGGSLCALELNKANRHATTQEIKDKAVELGLFITRGSDNHENTNKPYEDMSFYETPKFDLLSLYNALKKVTRSKSSVIPIEITSEVER